MVKSSNGSFLPLLLFGSLACLFPSATLADVQITKLDDLSFGSWGGTGNLEQTDQVCVYNTVDANYAVSASTPSGFFRMNDGGNVLPYEIRFQGSSGGFVEIDNSPTGFTAANTTSANCGGGTNATLKITVTESALSGASPGNYSGTLSLLIEPN
jgi:hypothetical protein